MLNEHQLSVICKYVGYLQDVLYLNDWKIEVSPDESPESGAIGSIDPVEGRRLATLRLCEGFCDMDIADQTNTLCHELIHLHHIGATDIIRLDLLSELSQSSYNILIKSFKRQMEYCVDGLANAFSLLVKQIDYNDESKQLETE